MFSNKQLIEKIEGLAKDLGVNVETQGLNNQKLTELAGSLEAKVEAKAAEGDKGEGEGDKTKAPQMPQGAVRSGGSQPSPAKDPDPSGDAETPKAPEATQAKAQPSKPPYVVAKGKSLTSKKGIIDAGKEIRAKDLTGGQDRLDELVAKGVVTKQ